MYRRINIYIHLASLSSALLIGASYPASVLAEINKTHTTELNSTQIDWNYERTLTSLPLKGDIGYVPWRDDYWATNRGEINRRWDDSIATMPSESEVKAMSNAELRNLSPAEKYDISRGDFGYTVTNAVFKKLEQTASRSGGSFRNAPGWEGLCHGWANASLNFKAEPKAIEYKGKFEKPIPFGSSDTKALLTWFQGEWGTGVTSGVAKHDVRRSIGKTCPLPVENPQFTTHRDCNDISPDVFHVVLANRIGIDKKGFVSDTEFNEQVWNFPVYRYKSTIKGVSLPEKGKYLAEGVKAVRMQTTIAVAIEIHPSWTATGIANESFATKTIDYEYDLILDAKGRIVDGSWIANSARPDTIWIYEAFNFKPLNSNADGEETDILSSELGRIYEAATAE